MKKTIALFTVTLFTFTCIALAADKPGKRDYYEIKLYRLSTNEQLTCLHCTGQALLK